VLRYIPRPKSDVPVPNKVHQPIFCISHTIAHHAPVKLFKYALTVVDVASRFKEAKLLTTKEAREVAAALERFIAGAL